MERRDYLYHIIQVAPAAHLRSALLKVCAGSREAYTLACANLLLGATPPPRSLERSTDTGSASNGDDGGASERVDRPSGSRRKRARPVYEICGQCDEEYDVQENNYGCCFYHDGKVEVDWDADTWSDCNCQGDGEIDTPEMRRDFPEGFIWTCCERLSDDPGCRRGMHRPGRGRKRART